MFNPNWTYQTHWVYTRKLWIVKIMDRSGNIVAANNFQDVEEGQKWVEDRLKILADADKVQQGSK